MEERRQGNIEIVERLARIEERLIAVDRRVNGSLDAVAKHIDQGTKWRLAIVIAFIGLTGVFVSGVSSWGKAEKQIEINTERLAVIEASHRR